MVGEIRRFKREVFGGFDRRDVIGYIKELAQERDMYRETAERLASSLLTMNGETEDLRAEVRVLDGKTESIRKELDATLKHAREAGSDAFNGMLRGLEALEERLYVDAHPQKPAARRGRPKGGASKTQGET
jgi:hypothetical protein